MSICQLGMHKSVQDHTNANVCKQTYDASCKMQEQVLLHLKPTGYTLRRTATTLDVATVKSDLLQCKCDFR